MSHITVEQPTPRVTLTLLFLLCVRFAPTFCRFFLYVTYVLIVIYYDKFLKMIGSDPLVVEKGDGDDASSTTSSVQHCPADEVLPFIFPPHCYEAEDTLL